MKKRTKILLFPVLFLVLIFLLIIILALVEGYQKIDIAGTHQRVPAAEFDRTYSPGELKQDLNFLMQTLEQMHPNLYCYTPGSIIAREKKRIEQELTIPMSRIDFYLKVAPLVAMLNDGHTKIYPPYEEYYDFLSKGGLIFPFDLDFREGKAIVAANYSSDSLIASGSELLSINRIPITDISERLLRLISGEKMQGKPGYLEEFFPQLLWLVYKFEQEFEIEFISESDGNKYDSTIRGVDYSTIQSKRKSDAANNVYYSYASFPDEKIGIINLRRFVDPDQFNVFLRETFTKIQQEKITDLIIDLRENPGGYSDLEDPLLSYLTDKAVINFRHFQIKASRQIKKYYRRTLRWYLKWLPFQYIHPTWRKVWIAPEGSLVDIYHAPEKPAENSLRFKGAVYLLIGPNTYSTAQGFVAKVQDFKLGTLIGEETGGIVSSFGASVPFDLPHTRLWVFVAHKRIYRPSGKFDGRGVVPDIEVKTSPGDRQKGIDTVLEYTKKLIYRLRVRISY